jgi:hypothetical protein
MIAANIIDLQKYRVFRPLTSTNSTRALRIGLGFALSFALNACVADAWQTTDMAATVPVGITTGPGPTTTLAPANDEASAMLAKARALISPESEPAKPQAQIDLGMLAMRSNPGATHRLDGPSPAGGAPDALPPDVVMARLRQLSNNPDASAVAHDQDDRSRDILVRLHELSRQAAPPEAQPDTQPPSPTAAKVDPVKGISPQAVMRRLEELTAAKANTDSNAYGVSRRDTDASAFGGLADFVPAPEMARTPAVGSASKDAAGAPQ